MDIEGLKKQFADEGFPIVYEWEDSPGTEYPPHQHNDKVSFYVTEGSITMRVGNQETLVEQGARFNTPPKTIHSATVGPRGCKYVFAQMEEEAE